MSVRTDGDCLLKFGTLPQKDGFQSKYGLKESYRPSTFPDMAPLVTPFLLFLLAHHGVFENDRIFRRAVALAFAEVLAFNRHTITQLLVVLGLVASDWSSWYRVLKKRIDMLALSGVLFESTLEHVTPDQPYIISVDGLQVPRTGRKIEGSSWLHNPVSPVFKRGIHRAQRFLHGAWFTPAEKGYSRAIPLRLLPAFTHKARRQVFDACKEWEAALSFIRWVRAQLDAAGRIHQTVLVLGDGGFDTLDLWKALTGVRKVTLLVRTAKNRVLYHQPPPRLGQRGRPRKYGRRFATPAAWRKQGGRWRKRTLTLRGRPRKLDYRVSRRPLLRRGAPDTPLYLIVVRGQSYQAGGKRRYGEPLYFLVNAAWIKGDWALPFPIETLLFWAWQRWEMEVTHRELKSGFGLGEKQCWNPISAVTSVQWSAWVYALLMLAAYQTYGLCQMPRPSTAWWVGSRRWSLTRVLQRFRSEVWGQADFQPLWGVFTDDWGKKDVFMDALVNITQGSARL
jgi:hypothetical protein